MCTTELGRGEGEEQGGSKEMSSIYLLTNSALVYESQGEGGGGEGGCEVSASECSCAHHVTWSPNKVLVICLHI
jgi:hypothetical protein